MTMMPSITKMTMLMIFEALKLLSKQQAKLRTSPMLNTRKMLLERPLYAFSYTAAIEHILAKYDNYKYLRYFENFLLEKLALIYECLTFQSLIFVLDMKKKFDPLRYLLHCQSSSEKVKRSFDFQL